MHHHHPSTAHGIHTRFAWSIALNTILTIVQIFYAYQAHAVSLLSDALHNLGDVLGLLMAWGAQVLLNWRSSERYSYGYKKSTILAALGNALLLLLSVGVIVYEAGIKLIYTQEMDEIPVMLIALVGILVNGGTALLFRKEKANDINIKAAFLHLSLDALTSFGVVLAAVLIYYTGYQWIDAIIALGVAGIMLLSSWNLLRRAIDMSLSAVPQGINLKAVRTYLMQIPGVTALHDLHIWGLSTQETALTAHLIMPHSFLVDTDYQRINQALNQEFGIQHVTLQVEKGKAQVPCVQALSCQATIFPSQDPML